MRNLIRATLATLMALGIVYAEKNAYHASPPEAEAYHARIRDAVPLIPLQIGSWLGRDVALPDSAVRMLHPNVTLARQYVDVGTNSRAELLIIQCPDARDLLGHYPPVCYPGRGWVEQSRERCEWSVGSLVVHATQYAFAPPRIDQPGRVVVNWMLLPDGRTCPDMGAVDAMARDPHRKFFGAAQIQIIFDSNLPQGVQEGFVQDVLPACSAWFDVVRLGE